MTFELLEFLEDDRELREREKERERNGERNNVDDRLEEG